MNIKDYIPGREVYALCVKFGRSKNYEIKKYIVRSVGRKYVKASPENFTNLIVDFYKPEQINDDYLDENKDWGNPMKLFASRQAAEDEIERDELKRWFVKEASAYPNVQNYTLEQLRKVRDVLKTD